MAQSESASMYRRIVKATGMLGGVQVFSILCSIVRNKCIAVWLGPAGVAIIGLYNTAIEMIGALTGFGLRQSAVREVSQVSSDALALQDVLSVIRRWSWLAGLLGAMVMLSTAPLLSRFTFGDDSHLWGYVWLSCALLLNALLAGEQAVLQGTQRLKQLSVAGVAGNFTALVLSLPLYYFFRFDGIVPSLLLSAFFTLFFVLIFSHRVRSTDRKVTMHETWEKGRAMVLLGVYMTVSAFLTTLFNYLLINFIHRVGGETELGYYQAGYAIVTRYVGLVLAAMATEFYPRLATVSDDHKAMGRQISRQIESALLILSPIVVLFFLFQDWVVRILYTDEFFCVESYFSWAMVGVLFKATSWAMGFVLLAKGAGKLYLITEFISDFTGFILNVIGYYWWGLQGIGVAYMLNFFIYGIIMWIVCHKVYHIVISRSCLVVLSGAVAGCSIVSLLCNGALRLPYWIAMVAAMIVCIVSLWSLKNRLTDR